MHASLKKITNLLLRYFSWKWVVTRLNNHLHNFMLPIKRQECNNIYRDFKYKQWNQSPYLCFPLNICLQHFKAMVPASCFPTNDCSKIPTQAKIFSWESLKYNCCFPHCAQMVWYTVSEVSTTWCLPQKL